MSAFFTGSALEAPREWPGNAQETPNFSSAYFAIFGSTLGTLWERAGNAELQFGMFLGFLVALWKLSGNANFQVGLVSGFQRIITTHATLKCGVPRKNKTAPDKRPSLWRYRRGVHRRPKESVSKNWWPIDRFA
jgi:hypothetical protein